jgi:hypothetical protein
MEYGEFLSILLPYKKFQEETSELNSIGFDFFEGKYQLSDSVYKLFQNTIKTLFTEEGVDWIEWFIYENDWGMKDWSQIPNMVDGKLIEKEPSDIYGARDEKGNLICYSFESLWEYVKKYLK